MHVCGTLFYLRSSKLHVISCQVSGLRVGLFLDGSHRLQWGLAYRRWKKVPPGYPPAYNSLRGTEVTNRQNQCVLAQQPLSKVTSPGKDSAQNNLKNRLWRWPVRKDVNIGYFLRILVTLPALHLHGWLHSCPPLLGGTSNRGDLTRYQRPEANLFSFIFQNWVLLPPPPGSFPCHSVSSPCSSNSRSNPSLLCAPSSPFAAGTRHPSLSWHPSSQVATPITTLLGP